MHTKQKRMISLILSLTLAVLIAIPSTAKESPYGKVGDLNHDDEVDAEDLSCLARIVGGIDALPKDSYIIGDELEYGLHIGRTYDVTDLNEDGEATALDMTAFARHLGNIEGLPLSGVTFTGKLLDEGATEGVEYRLIDGEAMAYQNNDMDAKTLVLSSTYAGYPVTSVSSHCALTGHFETLFIPDTITYIGQGAIFSDALKSVTFPDSVQTIDSNPVNGSALEEVIFPETVANFPVDYILGANPSLKHVVLPKNIEEVGRCAFAECSSLAEITLPKSVKIIGSEAFAGCISLKTIYYEGTKEEWQTVKFRVYDERSDEFIPQDEGTDWRDGVTDLKVVCTDGVIDLG